MSTISGTLPKSCCTLPPAQAEYTPKGEFITLTDLKTYAVGPEDAEQAILVVYDVFGHSPQALQGADLLASQGFRVVIPDFLLGKYATPDMFTGDDAGNKKRSDYFSTFPGAAAEQSGPVGKVINELKSKHSKLGAAGFCWGWKAIVLANDLDKVDAIATGHPSFAAVDDADKITQPVALLPSQGEDIEVLKKIYETLEKKNSGKNFIKHYDQFQHGFLAARADLKDPKAVEAFNDGYTTISSFFKQNL